MTIKAHFDGRSLIPDEPIDLPQGQTVIVHIEQDGSGSPPEAALEWLAANAVPDDELPSDLAYRHDEYLYGHLTKDE